VRSMYPFTVSLVDTADDGLLGAWNLSELEEEGGVWLTVESASAGEYAPFAAFGPMLQFTFTQVADEPFTEFEMDNTMYLEGQTLYLEN